MTLLRIAAALLALLALPAPLPADDWPEFRGAGRLGVWRETGVLDAFPADGLKIRWRAPIGSGFAGPAVAAGRVFVLDFTPAAEPNKEIGRASCRERV